MTRRIFVPIVLAAVGFAMSVGYTNCASSLPDVSDSDKSTSPSTSTGTSNSSVQLIVFPNSINVGQTAQAQASGGTPPYTYTVSQGSATVNSMGMVLSSGVGPAVVQVSDSQGRTAVSAISIVTPATTVNPAPAGASCTTAWGVAVANGASVIGFGAASVECPATCTQQTLACVNGTLVGGVATAASCSVQSCVPKLSVIFGCPMSTYPTSLEVHPQPTCSAQMYHTRTCAFGDIPGSQLRNIQNEYYCVSPSEVVNYTFGGT